MPGRPEQRPDGCAPLWRCVDFDASLGSAERAGLEAALEASGLLDALVTPEGGLLDPESLDTAIAEASAAGRTLAGWLAPDPAGPQPAGAVAAALAVVGAGPAPASEAWVDLDGRWANGALSGRWAKEQAEFVGASARAAARARRIAEIDRQMELLAAAIRTATRSARGIISCNQRSPSAPADCSARGSCKAARAI